MAELRRAECVKTEEPKEELRAKRVEKKKWEKPCLEDVSGKVMAQPYIRFT